MIALLSVFAAAKDFGSRTAVVFPDNVQSVTAGRSSSPNAWGAWLPSHELEQTDSTLPLNAITTTVPSTCSRLIVSTEANKAFKLNQVTPEQDWCLWYVGRPSLVNFEVISNVSLMNQLTVEYLDGNVVDMAPRGYGKWSMTIQQSMLVRWSIKMPTTDRPEIRISTIQRDNSFPYKAHNTWFDVTSEPFVFDDNLRRGEACDNLPPAPTPTPVPLKHYNSTLQQVTNEGLFRWVHYLWEGWFVTLIICIILTVAVFKWWGCGMTRRNGQDMTDSVHTINRDHHISCIPPVLTISSKPTQDESDSEPQVLYAMPQYVAYNSNK